MKIRGLFVYALGLLLVMVGCGQKKSMDEMESFKSHPFRLYTDSMAVIYPQNAVSDEKEGIPSCYLVVYSDSTVCNPCAAKVLYQWNALVDSLKGKYGNVVKPCFIFSPKREQVEEVKYAMEEVMIGFPVYIDTLYLTARNNPQLPANPLMHTFLVDKEGKVLLVGSPLKSRKMEKLMYDVLDELIHPGYAK